MPVRISTGIEGLDRILNGGLIEKRAYLLRGGPGAGKTTIGYHFLTEGVKKGEKSLFITLGEKKEQLIQNAATFGLNLEGVEFLDLSPTPDFFAQVESYDIFSPADVEREPVTKMIINVVESIKPQRIFIDSMTQFRYLAPDTFQFRKQALSFIRYLTEHGGTILFTSEASCEAPDDDLMFLSDGIINLRVKEESRTIEVTKFRGSSFLSGLHSYTIGYGGITIFPRLVPELHTAEFSFDLLSSGIPEIDELLNGGLERGTVTLISGPSGVGKSTMGMVFLKEAAGRGENSVVYTFEETSEKILSRCESVNIPARAMVESGRLKIRHVEPLTLLPDEFANLIERDVEEGGAKVVMIDSTSGYEMAMGGENPRAHLHAVCRYLTNMGVLVLLPTEVRNITGEFKVSDHHISYLADNIVFLRYLEIGGEMRRAIGVLKKKFSDFEKTLREFKITRFGIKVGDPLSNLRNILSGSPFFVGEKE